MASYSSPKGFLGCGLHNMPLKIHVYSAINLWSVGSNSSVKIFITAEYPDLWPLLLSIIADLAESVQDFIVTTESSNPSHQQDCSKQFGSGTAILCSDSHFCIFTSSSSP